MRPKILRMFDPSAGTPHMHVDATDAIRAGDVVVVPSQTALPTTMRPFVRLGRTADEILLLRGLGLGLGSAASYTTAGHAATATKDGHAATATKERAERASNDSVITEAAIPA